MRRSERRTEGDIGNRGCHGRPPKDGQPSRSPEVSHRSVAAEKKVPRGGKCVENEQNPKKPDEDEVPSTPRAVVEDGKDGKGTADHEHERTKLQNRLSGAHVGGVAVQVSVIGHARIVGASGGVASAHSAMSTWLDSTTALCCTGRVSGTTTDWVRAALASLGVALGVWFLFKAWPSRDKSRPWLGPLTWHVPQGKQWLFLVGLWVLMLSVPTGLSAIAHLT